MNKNIGNERMNKNNENIKIRMKSFLRHPLMM